MDQRDKLQIRPQEEDPIFDWTDRITMGKAMIALDATTESAINVLDFSIERILRFSCAEPPGLVE